MVLSFDRAVIREFCPGMSGVFGVIFGVIFGVDLCMFRIKQGQIGSVQGRMVLILKDVM